MKKLTQPGLFLIFCLSILNSNANSMEDVPASIESDLQSDSLALVAFYNAMDGPNWTNNTNWLTGPLNTWHGVSIDTQTDRVYVLEQLDNGLNGSIPPEIGNLDSLRLLHLTGQGITGEIPGTIGNMVSLELLLIYNTNISGALPNEVIGLSSNLNVIYIYQNSISSLPDLSGDPILNLDVHDNQLTFGSLEPNISKLPNATSYTPQGLIGQPIDTTLTTGSVFINEIIVGGTANLYQWYKDGSPIVGATDSLLVLNNVVLADSGQYHLEVTNTIVTGLTLTSYPIVVHVEEMMDGGSLQTDSLALVALYNATDGPNWNNDTNWLTGPLSTWHGVVIDTSFVTELNLSSNGLDGTLPQELGDLGGIRTLSLGGNSLADSFDVVLNLVTLEDLYLSNNDFTGAIPQEIGNLVNLRNLALGENPMTGTIPATIGNLTLLEDLGLYNMGLQSPIPTEIGNLVNLKDLLLHGNNFSESFPLSITTLPNLEELYLSNNNFSDSIPPQIGNLTNLRTLALANNNFTGSLPPEIGLISSLYFLILEDNQLSGTIPVEIGSLPQLESVVLRMNQFEGNPFDILTNPQLRLILIDDNNFNGIIPDSIGNLTNLESIWLHDNMFSGDIPDAVGSLPNLSSLLVSDNSFTYLPDLSGTPVDYILAARNRFTFESIEPNIGIATTFSYSPQDSIGSPLDTALVDGVYFEINIPVGGTANGYQWYKDGSPIPGAIDSLLIFNSFSALDTGTYYLEVTNTIVPALTLKSYLINLSIIPDSSDCNYIIPDMEATCSSPTFMVPVIALDSVSSEVIGFDFCMEFDTTYMIPTGNATVGALTHGGNPGIVDYFLNTNTPGQVSGLIFFNGAAPFPSFFSGSGLVIEVEFAYNGEISPGSSFPVSLCSVSESTLYSGELSHCTGNPGNISVINDPTFVGTLKYWDKNGKLLVYDDLNPLNNIPTIITGADTTCTAIGTSYLPDLNGQFTFEVSEGDYFTISRDIPGQFGDTTSCTNVMSWINGADQNRALRIATMDPTFIPNVYQVIAADVNQDGLINAADITLISARSVMNICGFTNDGINPAEDWLFIDQYTVENEPVFTISSTYPLDDGMGYHRGNVPSIPDCLPVPTEMSGACTATMSEDYIAILLGDVNGNWKTTDGGSLRIDESLADNAQGVSFDFASMRKEDQYYYLPVVVPSVDVEALDFYFEFKEHLTIEEVILISDDFEVNYNVFNEKIFLYSSYQLDSKTVSGTILELKLSSSAPPIAEDFLSGMAFVDSEPISISTAPEPIVFSDLKIYPNPVQGELHIEWPDDITSQVSISLINMSGQTIYADLREVEPNTLLDISMAGIKHGIYFLEIKADNTRKIFKIINQ